MVKFKVYDKKLKKFVSQNELKAWRIRHDLGIWNNGITDTRLGELYKLMKQHDKHLELHAKLNGRFKPVTNELIEEVEKQYKQQAPERAEARKRWKEESLKFRENGLRKRVKECKKKMKTYKMPDDKHRIKRCKRLYKKTAKIGIK